MPLFDRIPSGTKKATGKGQILCCDGGVLGMNPSRYGGMIACRLIEADGEAVFSLSRLVFPAEIGLPKVTNNVTELMAVLLGMDQLPDHWSGCILTDSQVTYYRIHPRKKSKFSGVPVPIIQQLDRHKSRLGRYQIELVKGHPQAEDLRRGTDRLGRKVHADQHWCDEECNRLAEAFFQQRG